MRKMNIWDIIFWIAMVVLIGYIIAKLFGLINTPDWFDLIPLITIAFLIGAFYQTVMNFMNQMYIRTDYLKQKLDSHDQRLSNLEKRRR
jgi:Na+/glutamate symporter